MCCKCVCVCVQEVSNSPSALYTMLLEAFVLFTYFICVCVCLYYLLPEGISQILVQKVLSTLTTVSQRQMLSLSDLR